MPATTASEWAGLGHLSLRKGKSLINRLSWAAQLTRHRATATTPETFRVTIRPDYVFEGRTPGEAIYHALQFAHTYGRVTGAKFLDNYVIVRSTMDEAV